VTANGAKRGGAGRWVASALVALLAGGLLWLAVEEGRGVGTSAPEVGKPAPPFTLERLGGGTVSLSELRGKVVVLDFWATWCKPCLVEIPYLTRIAQELGPRGLVLVAANRDEPPQAAKAEVGIFVAQKAPDFGPFVAFADDEMTRRYGVEALPTLFLIDRDGRLISRHRGTLSEATLRELVEGALAR
jgi:thiol-disulfide isomerase/thioredoxin